MFSWATKQELLANNPCRGVERNATVSRERVLSDTEVPLFWQAFGDAGLPGMALRVLLLTGQRPGEVTRMRHDQITDGWWTLPGAPDAATPAGRAPKTRGPIGCGCRTRCRKLLRNCLTSATNFVFGQPLEVDRDHA